MNIYSPYTDLLSWTSLDKHYYGVRFSKRCSPKDLWISYFSSSKEVKKYRELYGEPDIIEVRKVFESGDAARLWEQKVLKRLSAARSDKWLNKHNSDGKFYNKGWGKQSSETIEKRRLANTGKKRSEETKRKISAANSNKTRSPELRAQISASLKGRTISEETIQKRERTKDVNGRPKPNLGKTTPDSIREKIRAKLKGKQRPKEVIEKIKAGQIAARLKKLAAMSSPINPERV